MSGVQSAPPAARPAAHRRDRCPLCGRPRVHRYRPFCSAACRDRDLVHWLEGRYRLPAVEDESEEEPQADSEPEEAPRT
ncbi:DNA gyrase inhibitor YacG [bacterium HR40]|nr:DNA gyrase inhibitor YacG [bacterium HR40]